MKWILIKNFWKKLTWRFYKKKKKKNKDLL